MISSTHSVVVWLCSIGVYNSVTKYSVTKYSVMQYSAMQYDESNIKDEFTGTRLV